LRDLPRPFVIRAANLDGRRYAPVERFSIDVHVFELHNPALAYFISAFSQLAESGLGPGRGRVHLESVRELGADRKPGRSLFDLAGFALLGQPKSVELNLEPPPQAVYRVQVCFRTPTELRSHGEAVSVEDFGALFARIRDRVSTLRGLYGEGPLEIDFRGMAARARAVRAVRSQGRIESARRRSSRTGRAHPLSGFTGEVDYEGELTEFVPFLEAAYWTGVGKHTVWGNGTIESFVG
jgi:CRISPR-associated endoribonuclease Cas6